MKRCVKLGREEKQAKDHGSSTVRGVICISDDAQLLPGLLQAAIASFSPIYRVPVDELASGTVCSALPLVLHQTYICR